MKFCYRRKWLVVAAAVCLLPTATMAESQSLEQRIERLERIVQGQGLTALLSRVDQLQNEIQRLNGDNEALNHQLQQLQNSQREMYMDLEQRLEARPAVPAESESPSIAVPTIPTLSPDADSDADFLTDPPPSFEDESAESQAPVAPVSEEDGEASYQSALQTLRSGQYDEAIQILNAFPEQYPNSEYLPNVYYWRGEAYYVTRNFEQAITSFQIVIDQYSSSDKVGDALLKRGFSEYELGQIDKARTTLNQVIATYPDTSVARLARVRLDRIQQESR